MSDLQSTGGIEFATENSKIFIPNVAIREQMNSEGAYIILHILYMFYDVHILN